MKMSNDFFGMETRSGYEVSSHMKEVWSIEIDILKEIIRICETHKLKYYVVGGTMLGAVRHKGYIPWDDDIDVSLLRKDFNKFQTLTQGELKHPFFLKTTETDIGYYSNSIYVCNSDTTGLEDNPNNKVQMFNKGISIGISSIDSCNPNINYARMFRLYIRVNALLANIYVGFNTWEISKYIKIILKLIGYNHVRAWKKLQYRITKYDRKWSRSGKVATFTPVVQKFNKVFWDKEDYSNVLNMDFEYMKVHVPKGFHNILSSQFGEYMKLPPTEKRKPTHNVHFEPQTPYKEYCSEKYGIKYD